MSADPDQQVVWITGASSGIGRALARRYAFEGAAVIVSARREDRLQALAQTLPSDSLVVPLDVTDEASIATAVHAAWAWKGRVDVLINNAGISQRASVLNTSMPTARRVMDVNFFGAVALTSQVVPSMVQRGQGHVVNITSVATYVAAPHRAFYSASKHALRAWSNTLRAELGGTGVHVTMVCPGYVRTQISKHALDGTGNPRRQSDPQIEGGMPPETVADQVISAVRLRRREVYVGGVEVLSIFLQRFTPGLVDWVLPDRLPWSDAGLLFLARRTARKVWGLSAAQHRSTYQSHTRRAP